MTLITETFDVISLAIDHENERLYWTNINTGRVYGLDFQGHNRETVIGHSVFTVAHGFVVENGTFFWSDPVERRLLFAHVEGTLIAIVAEVQPRALEGLYYFKSDRVIPGQHVCAEDLCSQLCFPNGLGFSCQEVTPAINGCPEDIFRTSAASVTTVSWIEPTAVSRSSGTTPVNLPYRSRSNVPGSSFFYGNTTVRYRFQDDVGNEAECAFNVVVTQPTTTRRPPSTKRPTTTRLVITTSPTESPVPPGFDINGLFDEYLSYTVIGILIFVLVVVVLLVMCVTCCCGCWQCTCRPKGRDPPPTANYFPDQYQMKDLPAPPYSAAANAGYQQGYLDPNPYYTEPPYQ